MELGVSFSRRTNNQGWPDNTRDWAADAGFTGGTKNPVALGLPQVDVTGYITLGHAYDLPKIWSYNNYQYNGSFTYIRGRHNMKFGADFLRYQYFSRNYGDTRGRMTFLGRFTNAPMADFVLGWAQSTRRQLDAAGPYHLVSNYSGFFQDDWKISPTLTLNFGLRYELMKPPQEKFGAWSMFVPSLGQIVVAGTGTLSDFDARIAATGLQQYVAKAAGVGMSRTLVRPDYNNFGPRFGFAWRPFGGTKSVIRGGYGIFYGTSSLYRLDEYSDTYPFSINESYSATSSNPLLLTVSDPYPVAKRRVGAPSPAPSRPSKPSTTSPPVPTPSTTPARSPSAAASPNRCSSALPTPGPNPSTNPPTPVAPSPPASPARRTPATSTANAAAPTSTSATPSSPASSGRPNLLTTSAP
ncbi:MAG: TonB-dependent receptor [Bryobacterales bacterium]|nr:TonB-dependent receptor [Bryobacterales bacterium]